MDDVVKWISEEGSGHCFFVVFPLCLLILFLLQKGRRFRFVIPSFVMSLVIVNPWFYKKWDELGLYAYWRLLWVVPVLMVAAGVVPAVTEKFEKFQWKALVAAAGTGLVIFGGTYLYHGAGGEFSMSGTNMAKLPENVVQVADHLLALEKHPRAVVQYPLGVYMRQYTGAIDIMYGRDVDGYILRSNGEASGVHAQLSDPEGDFSVVAVTMANNAYDYLVLEDGGKESALSEQGFEFIERVAGYGIYKGHGKRSVIKEKNALGLVTSVTTVDEEEKPVNNESGYAKVSYTYDSYGNVIREFYTDVDGNGVVIADGRAGYERKYDSAGQKLLMERYIDPDEKPVCNSVGYAEYRREYQGRDMVQESYFDDKGQPVERSDTKYAVLTIEYDGAHHNIDEQYFDAEGAAVCSTAGYARVARKYEDGQKTEEAYFNADGAPVTLPKGYAVLTYSYDAEGRLASQTFCDARRKVVNGIDGYAREEREYDEENNLVLQRYLDASGKRVVSVLGYAEVHRVYEETKLVRETYLDADGKALVQEAGYAAIVQEWDEDVLVSRTFLGADGNPVMRKDGYAKAVWQQDAQGTWNLHFEDMNGAEVSLDGKNLAKDVRFGPDGWSEWMMPVHDVQNSCFNLGYVNLGAKQDGDLYTCQVEIEFKDVESTPGQELGFWAQGSQDGRWFTGNVWNSNLVYLTSAPEDGVYSYTSTMAVTGDMVNISTFALGFRCDNWQSGAFRVRKLKVEKGDTAGAWSPGV